MPAASWRELCLCSSLGIPHCCLSFWRLLQFSRVHEKQCIFCPTCQRCLWRRAFGKRHGTDPTALSCMGLCFQRHVSTHFTPGHLTHLSRQPQSALRRPLSRSAQNPPSPISSSSSASSLHIASPCTR